MIANKLIFLAIIHLLKWAALSILEDDVNLIDKVILCLKPDSLT